VSRARAREVLDQVADLPSGPERDRRALELLTDVALERPGLVALAFRSVTQPESAAELFHGDDLLAFEIFAVEPAVPASDRLIRVLGALGALAVLCLTANHLGDKTAWRPRIVATCFDALGPGPAAGSSDQGEA
jgi:hypothetical protein